MKMKKTSNTCKTRAGERLMRHFVHGAAVRSALKLWGLLGTLAWWAFNIGWTFTMEIPTNA